TTARGWWVSLSPSGKNSRGARTTERRRRLDPRTSVSSPRLVRARRRGGATWVNHVILLRVSFPKGGRRHRRPPTRWDANRGRWTGAAARSSPDYAARISQGWGEIRGGSTRGHSLARWGGASFIPGAAAPGSTVQAASGSTQIRSSPGGGRGGG